MAVEFDISINFHKNELLSRRTKESAREGGRRSGGVYRGPRWGARFSFEARDRNAEVFNLLRGRGILLSDCASLRVWKNQTFILSSAIERASLHRAKGNFAKISEREFEMK